ncbi:MAG: Asp-tRNA(Asn)/Glu-tRNA(Gln) amidotransferase subunit GatC [Acidobacteria bacterium]|nr:MAG: Asp-tRNA(Asn)/Glu-tRNA(Gln) amidotransferase subunit GatC [Acidobacteriota bacterium]
MSLLTRADATRIATLARLELTEPELDLFARQLTSILEYADRLQAVDTTGVPPYAGGLGAGALRDDQPASSLAREDALGNAPGADVTAGTFVVPKVIG